MKKVLLITYYWPPAGGAGVQRWLKMSKFIAKECDLTVFSPENAAYPILDESLKDEVSKKIKPIQSKIWEPYAWAKKINPKNNQYQKGQIEPKKNQSLKSKISLWVRANLFIPDARMLWIPTAVKAIQNQINLNEYDAIISTGPPHTCHIIALKLKEKYPHLQWLADFRDPWTEIDYFSQLPLTKWAFGYHQKLEQKVLQKADIVTTVSPSWAEDFQQKSKREVAVVYNGFDASDFKTIQKNKNESDFILTYIGSLNSDRNPQLLWAVLNEKCKEKEFKNHFKLKIIGSVAQEVKTAIEQLKYLKENTEFIPYMEHSLVIGEMFNSSVLLLLINDTPNQKGIIPGKFFEYLATKNEILCIGNPDSDIYQIIQKMHCGSVIKREDKTAMQDYLSDLYQRFCQNKLALSLGSEIKEFSRENAAKKIIKLLHL